jgi:hypothetical protein
MKASYVQHNKSDKLPEFYCNLKPPLDDASRTTGSDNIGSSDHLSDNEDDSDFVDSDYELEDDDDDLFADNVEDDGVGKGKRIGKRRLKVSIDDDVSTDDDGLQLPGSKDEGDIRFGFKSFREEDICNPIFKVGMMFELAVMLRKAITEYSLKNKVEIKVPCNEPKRIRAHCDADCQWYLFASFDERAHGLLVKTYRGEHTCQKKWKLKRCTSKWLAEKYVDSFRADQKMSLANFARVVQKDWNLTPSRSKLARARRLAMKKVMGDELSNIICYGTMHMR